LRVGGLRDPPQQIVRGDDQTRRAEAALDRACIDERLLDAGCLDALDGHDLPAVRLASQDEAGAHERAVKVNRARAALALLARVLGAIQAESFTEHIEQALPRPHVFSDPCVAVDGAGDPQSPSGALRAPPPHKWGGVAQAHARQRRDMTASACRRYAAVPRTSSIGLAAAATSSPKRLRGASL